MTKNLDNLYSLDVEADGPCPGLYSMLSFGLVPLAAPERAFYTTLAPISDRYEEGALAVNKWTREQTLAFTPADQAMAAFAAWLEKEPGKGRKVIWSDNPAFDWQFFNYYSHAFLGKNDFGHSARRIGDFAAGLEGDPRATSNWKKWRTEAHTHNALEDARGNAGALRKILSLPVSPRLPQAKIASYALGEPTNPFDQVTLEAMPQRDGRLLWAIRNASRSCLNKSGQWEFEPMPSSRDDAFLQRCRWDTPEKAYKAWEKTLAPKAEKPRKPRRD